MDNQKELFYMQNQERAALVLGAAAIPATFFVPIVLPFLLGSIAIVFALLARGRNMKLGKRGRRAVILGTAAIVINIIYLGYAFLTMRTMLTDPSGRQQISDMLYRMYGMSLEDFMAGMGLPQSWP